MEPIDDRLAYGAMLINTRRWRRRSSLDYVLATALEYPYSIQAWLQAYTLALMGRHSVVAMACMLEVLASEELTPLAQGALNRDMTIALIRSRHEDLAHRALTRARQHHKSLDDPNLMLCLGGIEARLVDTFGDGHLAHLFFVRTSRDFELLGDQVNGQFMFNMWFHHLRNAKRTRQKGHAARLRDLILHDKHATWRHRLAARLLSMPLVWRVWRW